MSQYAGKRSRWFPRSVKPSERGVYECGVKVTSSQRRPMLWDLEFDGTGFLVPFPMIVCQWRGLARPPRSSK